MSGQEIICGPEELTRRRFLPLRAELLKAEMTGLLQLWWRRGRGRMPSQYDFDIGDLAAFRTLFGRTHLVDVTAENPLSSRFLMYGSSSSVAGKTDWRGAELGEMPVNGLRDLVASDYASIKATASPALSETSSLVGENLFHFRRLILPLSDNKRDVSQLFVACLLENAQLVPELVNDCGSVHVEDVDSGGFADNRVHPVRK